MGLHSLARFTDDLSGSIRVVKQLKVFDERSKDAQTNKQTNLSATFLWVRHSDFKPFTTSSDVCSSSFHPNWSLSRTTESSEQTLKPGYCRPDSLVSLKVFSGVFACGTRDVTCMAVKPGLRTVNQVRLLVSEWIHWIKTIAAQSNTSASVARTKTIRTEQELVQVPVLMF